MPPVDGNEVVELIRDDDRTFVGTGDIADHFEVTRQTVRNHREALRHHPRLCVDKLGKATVFYLEDRDENPSDEQPVGGMFDRAGGGAMASTVAFVAAHNFIGDVAAMVVAVVALGIATYIISVATIREARRSSDDSEVNENGSPIRQ